MFIFPKTFYDCHLGTSSNQINLKHIINSYLFYLFRSIKVASTIFFGKVNIYYFIIYFRIEIVFGLFWNVFVPLLIIKWTSDSCQKIAFHEALNIYCHADKVSKKVKLKVYFLNLLFSVLFLGFNCKHFRVNILMKMRSTRMKL